MGTEGRRHRRRPQSAGYFETGHERSAAADAPGGPESIAPVPAADGRVMDWQPLRPEGAASREPGDFSALLRRQGLHPAAEQRPVAPGSAIAPAQTESTTILAFKFADGVLVAGDRRATAGNLV